ncbi:MENTAL domain-containing protein [Podarcis lilfordi]|uniref:MENTAL domain-containing protein n=1 Tax=Podarcis lilfordi TaxID=74358 RepID=A0AA35L1E3_9SAUR|nr:MENTAL domain-containing protein [Podarcis lilfordi]
MKLPVGLFSWGVATQRSGSSFHDYATKEEERGSGKLYVQGSQKSERAKFKQVKKRSESGASREISYMDKPDSDVETGKKLLSLSSHPSLRDVHSINPAQLMARIESYESREKKGISDVRRTFCLFVTFDLLFITLLWIIELNVNGGIEKTLEKEVLQYDYHSSYFDIFLLAVFRFMILILAYALCRLQHWWAIAFTTAVTSAFLLAKVILSKLLTQGAFGYTSKFYHKKQKKETDYCWYRMPLNELLLFTRDSPLMDSSIPHLNLKQDLMKNLKKNRTVKNLLYSKYDKKIIE